jgi:hypothetical protein
MTTRAQVILDEGEKGSQEDLDALFAACDAREEGTEPDWEEHLAMIERSKGSGAADA